MSDDIDEADEHTLFPAERERIASAVESRRREFVVARMLARLALADVGQPPVPLLSDPAGAVQWPAGLVGSITHCVGYRAAAVAPSAEFVSLGIDAETNAALPDGVLDLVALPDEREALARLPETGVSWPRLLFSCKESVYKAWYPMTGGWLDFEQARVTIDADHATFHAELLVPGPQVRARRLTGFDGSWAVDDRLLATAVVIPSGA
jgi:4'-phosphopantetheinyl transferase EntD